MLHIHDVVDYVSDEAAKAGRSAAKYIKNDHTKSRNYTFMEAGRGVNYVLPQLAKLESQQEFSLRVSKPYYDSKVIFKNSEEILLEKSFRALHPSQMEKISLEKNVDNEEVESIKVVIE